MEPKQDWNPEGETPNPVLPCLASWAHEGLIWSLRNLNSIILPGLPAGTPFNFPLVRLHFLPAIVLDACPTAWRVWHHWVSTTPSESHHGHTGPLTLPLSPGFNSKFLWTPYSYIFHAYKMDALWTMLSSAVSLRYNVAPLNHYHSNGFCMP